MAQSNPSPIICKTCNVREGIAFPYAALSQIMDVNMDKLYTPAGKIADDSPLKQFAVCEACMLKSDLWPNFTLLTDDKGWYNCLVCLDPVRGKPPVGKPICATCSHAFEQFHSSCGCGCTCTRG
jgi:hypothetical protein